MRETEARSVEPVLRPEERDMELFDWMDDQDFNPNYLKRAHKLLPRRGASREWRHTQDHWQERSDFPAINLEDKVFLYRRKEQTAIAAE